MRSLLRISTGDMIRSAEMEAVKLDLADGLGGGVEEIETFRPCATEVRRTAGQEVWRASADRSLGCVIIEMPIRHPVEMSRGSWMQESGAQHPRETFRWDLKLWD